MCFKPWPSHNPFIISLLFVFIIYAFVKCKSIFFTNIPSHLRKCCGKTSIKDLWKKYHNRTNKLSTVHKEVSYNWFDINQWLKMVWHDSVAEKNVI